MRCVRRISIIVEHREIWASIPLNGTTPGGSGPANPQVATPAATNPNPRPPSSCPGCSGTSFISVQDALRQRHIAAGVLEAALTHSRLHLQQQPDGMVWICRHSWEQLTGELP